jgi:hypothetical protein
VLGGAIMRPPLPGSETADSLDGTMPFVRKQGPKAMAGSPDAEDRPQRCCGDSVSPSCCWLSHFRENHERQSQCSIFIVYNWTGVAANSR